METRICAWMTRHPMTTEQSYSLREYEVITAFHGAARWRDAYEALDFACRACGRHPDLYVVTLPGAMLADLVRLVGQVAPSAHVISAQMRGPDYDVWAGRWRAWFLDGTRLDCYIWSAECVR